MKILAVSDFIEPLSSDIPKGNVFADVQLIASCGDLPPNYLTALSSAFAAPLYYIRGNHDLRYESSPPKNCYDIHAQVVSFGGLNILGLEGSHWYNGRPLQYSEAQMRQIVRFLQSRLRKKKTLDIVITHAPPRHIHDGEDPCHRGFQVFRHLIERYRPKYFLHGHIHRRFDDPRERITRIGPTRVVNCSGYYLFEYEPMERFGGSSTHRRETVKRFRDEQEKEGAYEYKDRGQQTVKLSHIVGSVNRYLDFDSKFRLKKDRPRERLNTIRALMQRGKPLPPVDLYKIKDQYYVLDGNHRISAAKERGFKEINARVVEYLPSKATAENILYRDKTEFHDTTGLRQSIELTEPGQYRNLLRQITQHRGFLSEQVETEVPLKEAAEDWYNSIYRPLAAILEKAGLLDSFPGRTTADLYAYISVHQWERSHSRSFGSMIDKSIARSMEEFRRNMKSTKEKDYPEMLREITVFVLIQISAKREMQILERIFELDEVREVHSVHGSIDLIAKLVLTRDLVSSDAEVISRYVQNSIRHIPGVVSTQTLIPGISKIKES
jgi:predicted phosphodiesterase